MDLYALIDCNNFYASCEMVFNPALRGRPVVVLSNNDGCVIARSQEAKNLGIPMGQPIFECWDFVKKNNVKVYSSNFVLYGDMSARVMRTLARFAPAMEVYSIDEAFLLFNGFDAYAPDRYAKTIQEKVKKETGLPVSVGMAATKTLAKVANHVAKKYPEYNGTFCLLESGAVDHWLKELAVEKIWGIGRRIARWLNAHGITNAYQLKEMPDDWIKKNLTIKGLRTVWELRGISCLALEEAPPPKKAIGTSRSFGYRVRDLRELTEAISAYTARTAEKLRKQKSVAGYLHIFIQTDSFKPEHYYENAIGVCLDPPSAYTPLLTATAERLLRRIYKPGYDYKRAGVLVTRLSKEENPQHDLFEENYFQSKRQKLMQIIDRVNASTNNGKLLFADEGLGKPWYMRQAHKSRRFTTRWNELLEISI